MLFINITYSLIHKYHPLPESLLLEVLKKERKKKISEKAEKVLCY